MPSRRSWSMPTSRLPSVSPGATTYRRPAGCSPDASTPAEIRRNSLPGRRDPHRWRCWRRSSPASRPREHGAIDMRGQAATKGLRKNKLAFWRERRAGRCRATRRRRCDDIVEERQRRAVACPPPRPDGLANYGSHFRASPKCPSSLRGLRTPISALHASERAHRFTGTTTCRRMEDPGRETRLCADDADERGWRPKLNSSFRTSGPPS